MKFYSEIFAYLLVFCTGKNKWRLEGLKPQNQPLPRQKNVIITILKQKKLLRMGIQKKKMPPKKSQPICAKAF